MKLGELLAEVLRCPEVRSALQELARELVVLPEVRAELTAAAEEGAVRQGARALADVWLSPAQVQERLGLTKDQWKHLHRKGSGFRALRDELGGTPRYRWLDVVTWMRTHRHVELLTEEPAPTSAARRGRPPKLGVVR